MVSAARARIGVSLRILLITTLGTLLALLLLVAFSMMAAAATHEHGHEGHVPAPAPSQQSSQQPSHEHDHEHAPAPAEEPVDQPRAVVLGGFAALNGAVLVGAAVARRRRPQRSGR